MKKFCLLFFLTLSFPLFSMKTQKIKEENITINVSGMVCGGCVRNLTDAFTKYESVAKINVDLQKQTVNLITNGSIIKDEIITKTIEEAGYKVIKINRNLDLSKKVTKTHSHNKKL